MDCQRLFVLQVFAKPASDLKCCFNRILTISFFSGVGIVLITQILPVLEINRRRQISRKLKLEPDCIVSWLKITCELEAVSSVVYNHLVHFLFDVSREIYHVTLAVIFLVVFLFPETCFFFSFYFDFDHVSFNDAVGSDVNSARNCVSRIIEFLISLYENVTSVKSHSSVNTVSHSYFFKNFLF